MTEISCVQRLTSGCTPARSAKTRGASLPASPARAIAERGAGTPPEPEPSPRGQSPPPVASLLKLLPHPEGGPGRRDEPRGGHREQPPAPAIAEGVEERQAVVPSKLS